MEPTLTSRPMNHDAEGSTTLATMMDEELHLQPVRTNDILRSAVGRLFHTAGA